MSEKQAPPSGLLSKVVRFVRNPTVSWTDLNSIDSDRESQYSKQMLKEMIERKRRNDFVRRREFDQLRKLRQRDALAGQRVEDPAARPSFFQSSMTSPDERAVTIKKIDEIEAQMSMQWWKSKQSPGAAPAASPSLKAPDGSAAHSMAFAPTAPMSIEDALNQGPAAPLFAADDDAVADATQSGYARAEGAADSATAGPGSVTATAAPLPPPEKFVHNPDLEEAAIRFANGDHDGAEASVQEVLTQHAGDAPAELLEIWMTLFDLYRATGQQDRFDSAAISFAARFDRSAPLWFSMPAQLGMTLFEPEPPAGLVRRDFFWNAPPTVTLQTVAALQAALGRAAPPWTFTWVRMSAIAADAVPALANEFSRWADGAQQVVFVGADHLRALLEAQTQSGDRAQDPEWWRLRMAALRLMGQPDEFEMVALDYCVTYEVSPPSWQSARGGYQGDSGVDADAMSNPDLTASPGWDQSSTIGGLSSPAPLPAGPDGLVGEVEGDATDALEEVAEQAPAGAALVVPCQRLIRIDFSAAGSVLNWAAEQQGQGRMVQFVNLHRLAAVFFNVVGINEYGSVVARKD